MPNESTRHLDTTINDLAPSVPKGPPPPVDVDQALKSLCFEVFVGVGFDNTIREIPSAPRN